MSKYHGITEETKVGKNGETVHRLIALETFENASITIEKGRLGGWVQNVKSIYDNAWIYDDAELLDNAKMYQHSSMRDNASMRDYSKLYGSAKMTGHSALYNEANMGQNTSLHDDSSLGGMASISDYVSLWADAQVVGNTFLRGSTRLGKGALVSEDWHVLNLSTHTTMDLDVTLYPTRDGEYWVTMGCWEGTVNGLEELFKLDEWVETEGQDVQDAREEMLAMVALMRARIKRIEARK